ncbi:hypothetical protein LCGC14_1074790 [marine sediment metagenome]|uniref:Uncharacterized protein n=1 Tax=marine sediment metagenome TaxID=412755 RepID=A0A0F9N4E1_9ZZZZ
MQLREWDYEAGPSGRYVEVEYPDDIIKGFVDYLRNTKQWRENPEVVYARWLVLERQLTEARNEAATQAADSRCTARTKSGEPCRITNSVEGGVCAIHRRALVAA